jgi:hypothetical protein
VPQSYQSQCPRNVHGPSGMVHWRDTRQAPPRARRGHSFPVDTAPLPARWPLVAVPDPPVPFVPLEPCLVGLAVVFRGLGRCLRRLRLRRGLSGSGGCSRLEGMDTHP